MPPISSPSCTRRAASRPKRSFPVWTGIYNNRLSLWRPLHRGFEPMAMLAAVPDWLIAVTNLALLLLGLFLILLILIQRGKGGGLAGAFGGTGGSSAFGSRAGDTFTRVTI